MTYVVKVMILSDFQQVLGWSIWMLSALFSKSIFILRLMNNKDKMMIKARERPNRLQS